MEQPAKSSGCYILQSQERESVLSRQHFMTDYWREKPGFAPIPGGRGGSYLIDIDGDSAILRHYYRGGMVSKLFSDQYFWMGKTLSRPWREWQILRRARRAGLPVPEPIAACCCRHGLYYRGAIITAYLEDTVTLAARLEQSGLKQKAWYRLGLLVKRMQAEGIRHADLNASNILVDSRDQFYLIDFDKARVMNHIDDWQWQPLYRLQRSLEKFLRLQQIKYGADEWQSLMDGYQS